MAERMKMFSSLFNLDGERLRQRHKHTSKGEAIFVRKGVRNLKLLYSSSFEHFNWLLFLNEFDLMKERGLTLNKHSLKFLSNFLQGI
jgi:hypothetical protein